MTRDISATLQATDDGWSLTEIGWEKERAVAVGSNFMVGNGYLGYRGTAPEQRPEEFVALVVTDTYDCADGQWRELTTAPNPLYVAATCENQPIAAAQAGAAETTLDLRTGRFGMSFEQSVGDARLAVTVERFASLDQLHLLAQRWTLATDSPVEVTVAAGIDDEVWSLNGVHLPEIHQAQEGQHALAWGTTVDSGIEVCVAASIRHNGPARSSERIHMALQPGQPLVVETRAIVYTSNDGPDPMRHARQLLEATAAEGFEELLAVSSAGWVEVWEAEDIVIGGNPVDQAALRFSAYHNRIATPAHADHLPIGARGLSCQAYQGAAFWDQEIYNLPAFLFTEPEIARSILLYRHRTLDGARRKAKRLGYNGAFYAWVSGDTGDELCPDHFFEDVLTGRPIRNHFNVWQIHVAPDIVTTVARYVEVTGDKDFLKDYGAEIAFEVARYLHSFVRYDEWHNVYRCIRLLGPDEWHENVDDNAFTNYQVRRALAFAVATYEWLAEEQGDALQNLAEKLALDAAEVAAWRRVRDHLYVPAPDAETKLVEQFTGFFELEDISPEKLSGRLLHPEEYWGWPNGIALATQVSKQADVAVLMWLHRDRFDAATKRANYEYYEPRCSHHSSLSHAAHGMVAADIGEHERAYRHFRATAMVDLLNTNHPVVGGTFIGGIHTAAAGGTYQLALNGFGGLDFRNDRLVVEPGLPAAWESMQYRVMWRGNALRVTATHGGVAVAADAANVAAVPIAVNGETISLSPGEQVSH